MKTLKFTKILALNYEAVTTQLVNRCNLVQAFALKSPVILLLPAFHNSKGIHKAAMPSDFLPVGVFSNMILNNDVTIAYLVIYKIYL